MVLLAAVSEKQPVPLLYRLIRGVDILEIFGSHFELPDLGPGLLGDKSHSMVFDNGKVTALVPEFTTTVPYWEGAAETIEWFDAHPDAQHHDPALDAAFDRLVARANE